MPESILKWKHFQSDIILLCVRWYLKYPLSYRNLEEMMAERGLSVSHTTMNRYVMFSNQYCYICSSPHSPNLLWHQNIRQHVARHLVNRLDRVRVDHARRYRTGMPCSLGNSLQRNPGHDQ
jgi:hypothetical protein